MQIAIANANAILPMLMHPFWALRSSAVLKPDKAYYMMMFSAFETTCNLPVQSFRTILPLKMCWRSFRIFELACMAKQLE